MMDIKSTSAQVLRLRRICSMNARLIRMSSHVQDAHVYVSEADAGHEQHLALGPQRQVYMTCIEGSLTVNGEQLGRRDAAEVVNSSDAEPLPVSITAGPDGAHWLLIEMARR